MDDNAIFPDDQHRQTRSLLAWYINGTLDESEEAAVEAHLAQCETCREDLAMERKLMADLPAAPAAPDVEAGWAAMRRRMAETTPPQASESNVVVLPARSFWRRPIPLGWALTGQAAALALMVGVGVWNTTGRASAPPAYHTLSSPAQATGQNMLVMFRPTVRESDLRSLLLANHAQLSGGPNLSGAYLLRVDPKALDATLSRLRGDPQITMAEPIDEGGQ